jgi:excinuclease ABC subunit A
VVINGLDEGDRLFSRRMACVNCGISVPELSPRAFSFNSPHGACPACQGLGAIWDFDPARVVPDPSKSLADGAIAPWARGDKKLIADALASLSETFGIALGVPFGRLPKKHRDLLLYGPSGEAGAAESARERKAAAKKKTKAPAEPFGKDFEGILPNLRRRYSEATWSLQEDMEPYRALRDCPECHGERLKPESRAVRVKGRRLWDYVNLPIADARAVFGALELSDRESIIAGRILKEIQDRLRFLHDVGVGYLTIARSAATLSGGEGQRIRLATQIGSNLTGVLYVLDEPSIGLHQRDNRALLTTLGRLRDLGNTVVVVEHDEETIRKADYVVDLGPGAGEHGGRVIFQGTPAELLGLGPRAGLRGLRGLSPVHRKGDSPRSISPRRIADGRVSSWRAPDRGAGVAASRAARRAHDPRRQGAQPEERGRQHSARHVRRGDRRERIWQVHAGERHPLQVTGAHAVPRLRRAGAARRD